MLAELIAKGVKAKSDMLHGQVTLPTGLLEGVEMGRILDANHKGFIPVDQYSRSTNLSNAFAVGVAVAIAPREPPSGAV